jgi:PKD repeat protein
MTTSNYPDSFDTDDNLLLVHDALRLRLAEDYNPGDTEIIVEGDALILSRWPTIGVLTLTEQCSDVEDRGISFDYNGVDTTTGTIQNLVLQEGFPDLLKPKQRTNVTVNVSAKHHNNIKDAIIAIQTFLGPIGTEDSAPFGETLEGRTNFLRKVALVPKAWFTADKRIGIVPLEVEFKNMSFRLGTDGTTGNVRVQWDFGDNTSSQPSQISVIEETSDVPDDADNVYVWDTDSGSIKKTYLRPGIYDVTLTVSNDFGSDTCVFPNFIQARIAAPDPAVIKFIEGEGQQVTPGDPINGPYEVLPKIRSPINTLISLEVPPGENPATTGVSYGGEPLSSGNPLDPITTYTWYMGDDLNHPNSSSTTASFGIGGEYDLKLRVETEFGAYRITTYENVLDIVENTNLWLWLRADSTHIRAYEYGLLSETFKVASNQTYLAVQNDSFLDGVPEEARQKQEFRKNTGFVPRGSTLSGQKGVALLYWATGRDADDPISAEQIKMVEYNGFFDSYVTKTPITRPWNWASFASSASAYFVFGATTTAPSLGTSPTNPVKMTLNLTSLGLSTTTLDANNFSNDAQELLQNPALFDNDGESIYGHFSVYRTAWKGGNGYIARNEGVGPTFRMRSFYRTAGTSGSPFQSMEKIEGIQGTLKTEGELTDLSAGIYFFNNTGSISKFIDTDRSWKQTGPGLNSVAYRSLQDTSVNGYNDEANTLLLTSDRDYRAYLSFDYSEKAFIKFNEIETTFSTLGTRPTGDQFLLGVY